jgi:2-amino-4-hydroxy-6-hydroxymethyldihydropteridine diphosphokinase
MPAKPEKIVLALGANMGNRMATLKAATEQLKSIVKITATSPVYETQAAYIVDQPVFLNATVMGETVLEPLELLKALKNLEKDLGRVETIRNGPRVIDIDILFYGDRILQADELTLPHPRMSEREFVLRPLADIASDLKHPVSGETIAEMLARVPSSHPKRVGHL